MRFLGGYSDATVSGATGKSYPVPEDADMIELFLSAAAAASFLLQDGTNGQGAQVARPRCVASDTIRILLPAKLFASRNIFVNNDADASVTILYWADR